MKETIMCLLVLASINVRGVPYVTNVVARQRYPWNGLVDVSYEIIGSEEDGLDLFGRISARDLTSGKTYSAKSLASKVDVTPGFHRNIWDAGSDYEIVSTSMVVSVSINRPALYLVVDIAEGCSALSYPTYELDDVPIGGWTDEYKTTKLVLRRIPAGIFRFQNVGDVAITKPFYIGVFEVTQHQCDLLFGYQGGLHGDQLSPLRPMAGQDLTWCVGDKCLNKDFISEEDLGGYIKTLRTKTGLRFTLPTEAQWEYACRAGTDFLYQQGDEESDLKRCAYYGHTDAYTTDVGSLLPNNWGLYDMLGNVEEFCLDWYGDVTVGDDPKGGVKASSNGRKVMRGGCYFMTADKCTVFSRRGGNFGGTVHYCAGLRLVCLVD